MKIDPAGTLPVYMQIIENIRMLRLSGAWSKGAKLPPVRTLAVELRVNPNTVAKAYRILQLQGIIESRQGDGSFLMEADAESLLIERRAELDKLLAETLRSGENLGFAPREICMRLAEISRKNQNDTGKGKL